MKLTYSQRTPKVPHYSLVYYHIPSVASRLLSRSDRFRGDRGSFGSQHLPLGNDGDGLTGGWRLASHGCFLGLKVPSRLLSGPKADMQCEETCLKWFDLVYLVWRSRFCWPFPCHEHSCMTEQASHFMGMVRMVMTLHHYHYVLTGI